MATGRKIHAQKGASMHKVRQSNVIHSIGYLALPSLLERSNLQSLQVKTLSIKLKINFQKIYTFNDMMKHQDKKD